MEEDSQHFKPNTLEQEIEQTKVYYTMVCTCLFCCVLQQIHWLSHHITSLEKSTLACLLASHREAAQ